LKDLPVPVSAIVSRLLAKTADERYQTAAGVEADLHRCLTEWESRGRIDAFSLGSRDVPDRLLIPEKLYGRTREIETLLAAFDRVVTSGQLELVLVSGYSGIGKSAVVNELHKVLVRPRGLFASGKFDQYRRDIPYATLAQALRTLVRQVLIKSEAEVDQWCCALKEALDPNGQLIVSLVPEVEFIIGKQPPVPDLPLQDAQNRFQLVFRRFISVFARPEHPLALFLDDLQWLDTATLDLLAHLVTHSEVRHLLLIGAYRDNEIGPAHPLPRTLEAIRDADAKVHKIVLAPLRIEDVEMLVADTLHCKPEHAQPLAKLLHEKTGGNPFFAIQFFAALAEEGLLSFDPFVPVWQWDVNRIRAKSYTDNVVDLMAGKLRRLSAATQEALKQLACLGNVAEVATLALIQGQTEETMHTALWEAVHAGLIFREDTAYGFLHDRIHQAAYSLVLDEQRADIHLQIGRTLLASMTADELSEHLFDVTNQLNRGAGRVIDRDEKTQVATINLRAGRKAKASAAYTSASAYLSAGMALLDQSDWSSQHALTFSLWLECAECEVLSGNFKEAEQLIVELLRRGASKVEQAAAYRLKVQFHVLKSENQQAVASARACVRLFGVDLPARPTWEQVLAEYETLYQTLNGRPIESLIDLPMMTDPEIQAAMQVLSDLTPAAYLADFHFCCLLMCRMVKISMQYGMSAACAHAYGYWGTMLGPVFHRYRDAHRFAKLGCDLVEKHGLIASHARALYSMGRVAFWSQPIATAIDFIRATFRPAIETGDLTLACYSKSQFVTGLLLRNDPLDAVWRESEMALDFAREAKYAVEVIVSQQRFIATMQGRTATFSTFNDSQFDEATFEAQLTGERTPLMICSYWILKLKARFLSGDYAEALAAADKAQSLLLAAAAQIQLLDFFYYTALTVAACYENASADEQQEWRDLLTMHQEQLREWAENYPPTFADKHALVLAEIARLEGRDADAMRLYETAIQSAHENGFVQNEGLAHELAARFYAVRGAESIAHSCLRNARYCYLRWGADGKVRQFDRLHPYLSAADGSRPTATTDSLVQQLDVASVVKASQAVSSEIVLSKLIERLMTIALENAGADRGLLILPAEDDHLIHAEARAAGDQIEVVLCQKPITGITCPEGLIRYVIRTHESVILDDTSRPSLFSEDDYLRGLQAKSILCLPLIKQGGLTGLLYLENTLTSSVFNPGRTAVLELLAAQAAISLENTRLYSDLQERETKVRRLVDANIIGIFIWHFDGHVLEANDAFLHMVGYDREDLVAGRIRWTDLTPPEWHDVDARLIEENKMTGRLPPFEKEYFRKDGSRMPVLIGVATFEQDGNQGVAFVLDLSERKTAEEKLRESERRHREAQAELAHVMRVTTLGELTASIAHEVNQPLAALLANAEACQLWLDRGTPNLDGARRSVEWIIKDGNRAADVIRRVRGLLKKSDIEMSPLDVNDAVNDSIALVRRELLAYQVSLRMELAHALPVVLADRVQLQQVIINLVINGIEAMQSVTDRPRELTIRTHQDEARHVLVTLKDSGVGISAADAEQLFNAFFTTKSSGMGMGLSICRSIIEAHGGRMWAEPNLPQGAIFHFTVPLHQENAL